VRFPDSSFTVELPEHLSREKHQELFNRLSEMETQVQQVSLGVYRIIATKPNQLARLGWMLFQTHSSKICTVIGTSGLAENRAGAYPNRPVTDN